MFRSGLILFLLLFAAILIQPGCLSVYHQKFISSTDVVYPKLNKDTRIPIYESELQNVQLIGRLQGAYEGSDEDIAKRLAKEARKRGANVIMNYKEKEKEVTFEHNVPPRTTYQTIRRVVRYRNPDGSQSWGEEYVTVPVYEPGYTYRSQENLRLIQCDFAWCEDPGELPGDIFRLSKVPKAMDRAGVNK